MNLICSLFVNCIVNIHMLVCDVHRFDPWVVVASHFSPRFFRKVVGILHHVGALQPVGFTSTALDRGQKHQISDVVAHELRSRTQANNRLAKTNMVYK